MIGFQPCRHRRAARSRAGSIIPRRAAGFWWASGRGGHFSSRLNQIRKLEQARAPHSQTSRTAKRRSVEPAKQDKAHPQARHTTHHFVVFVQASLALLLKRSLLGKHFIICINLQIKIIHHDFHDHDPQSKGRHYDLPSISVSRMTRIVDERNAVPSRFSNALSRYCYSYRDDVNRAAADSFRLQVSWDESKRGTLSWWKRWMQWVSFISYTWL